MHYKYVVETDVKSYVDGYRDAERFLDCCRQCRAYGHRHGCPPFDYDPIDVISRYEHLRIIGAKIMVDDRSLPLSEVNSLMAPVAIELNTELLQMEAETGGVACGFAGTCPYCNGAPCTRLRGKPCRHPDKVRPSLEAWGFDIGKTAQQLLGIELKWGTDGRAPEYLTLVCGLFY
ncbi:MAG: DUF2284 domain-containing protein [Prevotella sp.]|nr:DUF2284 domain-containing protein [Prevotella sp.]